jgi:hypothetical protein
MDEQTKLELEAAAFRRLLAHLDERKDVQNIDMMNLTGFCRNCLSRWYQEAAAEKGIEMDKEAAREVVYGMPYAEWKALYPDRGERGAESGLREGEPRALIASGGTGPGPRDPIDPTVTDAQAAVFGGLLTTLASRKAGRSGVRRESAQAACS